MNTAALFPLPKETTDSWNFPILEDVYFSDDIWNLKSLMSNKRAGVHASGYLDFRVLNEMPLLIDPIKRYCYVHLGQAKAITVAGEYNSSISKIIHYLKEKQFNSLKIFSTDYFIDFNLWLKEHYYKGQKSTRGLTKIANFLFQVINVGQAMEFPNLPLQPIRLEVSIWDWWGENQLKQRVRDNGSRDKAIPIFMWKKIIDKAWSEDNVMQYIKSGKSEGLIKINNAKFSILIGAHTGLRISEILYLKTGCVEQDDKERYWLNAFIQKTEAEVAAHKILIPKSIYELILELDELSEALRKEAHEDQYLFYILSHRRKKEHKSDSSERLKPVTLESGKWNHNYLRPFLKRHNIDECFLNANNERIRLTSHCFRHTFAKIAVGDQNVNPAVIQTHFKHLSIEMTMHYVHLSKMKLKESYIKGMIESKNIITQGTEGEQFKKSITNIKNMDKLNESINNLSKLYGINPLPFGLCLYDFKRGHCPHLGVQSCYMSNCRDFVTNEKFLFNFENEYKRLQEHKVHCTKQSLGIEVKKAEYQLHKIKKIIDNINMES